MESIKKNLGSRIRQIRKAAKMSAEELAEHADVHPNSIYTLERGENWVSPELLERICISLKVSPATLFEDESLPIPSPGIPRDLLAKLADADESKLRRIAGVLNPSDELLDEARERAQELLGTKRLRKEK